MPQVYDEVILCKRSYDVVIPFVADPKRRGEEGKVGRGWGVSPRN